MKKVYFCLALVLFCMTSCKKEVEPTAQKNKIIVPFTEVGRQMKSEATTANPVGSLATPNANSGANPAHGQAGHRCDIPVGAPLNTPKNSNAVAPATNPNSNPATSTPVTPPAVVTAEGMNPPHGQENHRCDIAVGAPLPKS